jgi:beta-glucosidase
MPSSPLKYLQAARPAATVEYDAGYVPEEAAAFAAKADVAIVFATQWQAEGADGSLTLPQGQDALIEAVARANPNTIVVLETGNPVLMPWLKLVKGVVEAWYPGQEGGAAIADVLTGVVNPSGRLPISFPASLADVAHPVIAGLGLREGTQVTVDYSEGADVGYRRDAAKGLKPLFAFGHGLSYTSFTIDKPAIAAGTAASAKMTVRNTGTRAGREVVQLYLVSAAGHPVRRLAGFASVELAAGESRSVTVAIEPRILSEWNGKGWTIAKGSYGFAVGASAANIGDVATINLTERRINP